MSAPIEDYAMIGDARTAAMISRFGSIDWFCAPRFDSGSMFGALLGTKDHGCWRLRPSDRSARVTRRYEDDTLILVTRWETDSGVADVHDFMPIDDERSSLVRRVVGISGRVEFRTSLRLRFDYARATPWVQQIEDEDVSAVWAIVGPDAVVVRGVELHPTGRAHHGTITVEAHQTADLTLAWYQSYRERPAQIDVDAALATTRDLWTAWAARIDHTGPYHDEVVRSLIVLRALSHRDTGGIVAAPTTSLPEQFGGSRNWDYRFVWLRDAALTLEVLVHHGFLITADLWRTWLLRAISGDPAQLQIMYGIAGERDLAERELHSLPGYLGAAPVRIGNGAVGQYQADVIGEVLVALEAARMAGLEETRFSWPLQRALLDYVEHAIDRPDNGIWEIRGEPRKFTQSRAMMWAAFDRGVRAIEEWGLPGPADTWRLLRDRLRDEIDARGVHPDGGFFVQSYGSGEVDAALLLLPQVGFCRPDDPRMVATVAEIERTLIPDGLVQRYRTESGVDGLEGTEHPFIACSFWLVEQYAAMGRHAEAEALMERACGAANDVGLLSEEYDVEGQRQVGNMPQALSHLALVRAADALAGHVHRAANRT